MVDSGTLFVGKFKRKIKVISTRRSQNYWNSITTLIFLLLLIPLIILYVNTWLCKTLLAFVGICFIIISELALLSHRLLWFS